MAAGGSSVPAGTIGWKVSSLAAAAVGVRHRALLPILALEPAEVRSRLFCSPEERNLDGLEVLVVVGGCTADDLHLARAATSRGIAVVFDAGGGPFATQRDDEAGGTVGPAFLEIARSASCVVAGNAPWAAEIRRVAGAVPVVVIPGGIDDPMLDPLMERLLRDAGASFPQQGARLPAGHRPARRVRDVLQRVLGRGAEVGRQREQVRAASPHDGTRLAPDALRAHWQELFREVRQGPAAQRPAGPYLAVVLHLVQDLDLALPILREARAAGLTCEAWCDASLLEESPRVVAALEAEQQPFRLLPGEAGLADFHFFPPRTRVLLTLAESNLKPHRVPRRLAEAAVEQGLLAATVQHGYENIGLTFDDQKQAIEKVDFASQRIYLWGPLQTLHPKVGAGVRARCVAVGCPKDAVVPAADLSGMLPAGRPVVGIFENLHWHRYDEQYRRDFIACVHAMAAAYRDTVFLLKPHHAGMWLTHRYQGERPVADNLVIADPRSPLWERHTAPALLGGMCAVITTPSTVALDAARRALPVAVVAGRLPLDNYRPLPLLSGEPDWIDFAAAALDGTRRDGLVALAARFVQAVTLPGNAARRIVEDLRDTAGA